VGFDTHYLDFPPRIAMVLGVAVAPDHRSTGRWNQRHIAHCMDRKTSLVTLAMHRCKKERFTSFEQGSDIVLSPQLSSWHILRTARDYVTQNLYNLYEKNKLSYLRHKKRFT
jgi:hypothetical protein